MANKIHLFEVLLVVLLMVTIKIDSVWSLRKCNNIKDCRRVTEDLKYVRCNSNGYCECLKSNGFAGDATRKVKCSCPFKVYKAKSSRDHGSHENDYDHHHNHKYYCKNCKKPNYNIYYDDKGVPRCVNLVEAENIDKQKQIEQRNKLAIQSIYNQIIYPNDVKLMQQLTTTGQLPDIFADNVRGRTMPLGEFNDKKGVVEYYYGVVAGSLSKVVKQTFIEMVAEGNKVFYRVDGTFAVVANRTRHVNLTHIGRFTFNEQGKVESFELSNVNLGGLLDSWISLENKLEIICGVSERFCTGNNTQYTSINDCVQFLLSKPEGTWYRANSDTVVCRYLHSNLAIYDPVVHCPHIGKTGGGKCITFSYDSFYDSYY